MLDPEKSETGDVKLVRKRRVEICVGLPEMLAGMEVPKYPGLAHHDECYFLNFVDIPDGDGVGQNGFFAQTHCLCMLKEATTAWLQGATEDETKAALEGSHDGDSGHDES